MIAKRSESREQRGHIGGQRAGVKNTKSTERAEFSRERVERRDRS
jgi:hypothetical protein